MSLFRRVMFSAPTFLLLANVIQYASSENYAYVKLKMPVVECTDIPNDGVCPRNHTIPDLSKIPGVDGKPLNSFYNKTLINITLTKVFNIVLDVVGASEACKKSYRVYFCYQLLPNCEDNNTFSYIINGEKTLESCEQAMKDCSALPSGVRTELIDCNITAIKTPKRISCQAYPDIKDDPYPCSMGNFMGPASFVSNERNNLVLNSHNMLKKYESKLDKKCVDDVAKVVCEATGPACTRDEKYIVDLVSKQDCQRIMGCLNVTKDASFINGAFGVCDHLADATTAKTISLSDVYFTTVQPTVQPSDKVTSHYVSIKPTASAPKPTASASAKPKTNVFTKPTDGTTIPGASIAMMFFAFLYFMQHLHYI